MPQRVGHLWDELISFDNLLRAATKACRSKRFRPSVASFHLDLERQLWRLHEELATKTYRPGPYRTFTIHEPKKRLISAAPYRDRVVHHALVNVLEPVYERCFSSASYACRTGKGTHAAVDRCQQFVRRYRYVFKGDVQKFFPSMDHAVLKGLLARKIKDANVLWLAGLLLDHSNPQEEVQHWFGGDDLFGPTDRRRGLPLGNQTSQFFANVCLDPLDHFLEDRLRGGGYVRYVDDFLAFADDKRQLMELRRQVADMLAGLRFAVASDQERIFPTRQGVRFLGYRVFGSHRLLAPANVWRFRRRLRHLQSQYACHALDWIDVWPRLASWIGHARQADTYRLRRRLFFEHRFRRATTAKPRPAWRLVQQSSVERPLGQPQQERAGEPQQ